MKKIPSNSTKNVVFALTFTTIILASLLALLFYIPTIELEDDSDKNSNVIRIDSNTEKPDTLLP